MSTAVLVRRARVHANHAHAWLYARSGGHARAVTVRGEERARLWRELCARDHRLEALQRRSGRELPLVRLTEAAV